MIHLALRFEHLATDINSLGKDVILNCAKTAMSSKIVGADSDFFGKMVVDAVLAVKTYNDMGDARYPIKSINILKARQSIFCSTRRPPCVRRHSPDVILHTLDHRN